MSQRFDAQARAFDRRAGMPSDAAKAVARSVIDLASLGCDDLVLELGAGTGQIGRYLAQSTRYVGIDNSAAMLDVFRTGLGATDQRRVRLSVADADAPWPVRDGSAAVVFASRVVHLLDTCHVVDEVRRVCAPGGHFLIGRVIRDPHGVQGRLRRQRQVLLARHGLTVRDREDATERVLTPLVAGGASRLEARAVARWTKEASVRDLLDAWERVGSAGGRRLEAAGGQRVLDELRAWAADEFGDLSSVASWEEQYVVGGVSDD